MSKRIKLPPAVKRRATMKSGKGWRLVNAKRTASVKAALISTFNASGNRFAIFQLRD